MTGPFSQLTLAQVAAYPRPGMAVPSALRFTPDGAAVTYLFSEEGSLVRSLWRADLTTGARAVLAGPPPASTSEATLSRDEELRRERARLRELGVTGYEFASNSPAPVFVVPGGGRLWVGSDGDPVAEVDGSAGAVDPRLSPDGSQVAFVRDDELCVLPLTGGVARRLTSGAGGGVTNGLAEFIAQEELDRSRGFWWGPDSDRIAFVRADSSHIPEFAILHQGGGSVETELHRYPFAGQPNALVHLGVVDLASGATTWMDLGPDTDIYLARVGWQPGGRLTAQVLSRDQRTLRLLAFDSAGAASLLLEEHIVPWLNLHGDTTFLEDGRFLWLSEASGHCHLSLHAPDGSLVRGLTSGDWDITQLVGVDERRAFAYFIATVDSPLGRHLYRVPLDGGEPARVTHEPGWHAAVLAPDGEHFVDVWSNREHSPAVAVRPVEGGSAPLVIAEASSTAGALGLQPPEFTSFNTATGVPVYGALYHPPALDHSRRYPLIVSVYGGPHAQRVTDTWSMTVDLRAQYLAQQGYVVAVFDNRGSAGRGLAFEAAIAGRLGAVEVDDQAAGVRHLESRPYIDTSRAGIYGWSYGGYMTLMALLRAPEVFKVGVAGAPVTDWDGYDTGYTERYLGTPGSNPEGYRASSILPLAANLRGRLLLVHGMVDENVHFRHTSRLITALTGADQDYELLVFPEERHMPRDARGMEYQERRVTRFLIDHL